MTAFANPGRGHVHPMSEADRVLGQIERGEIRCGPDAAREIAARHQEAYGDVWDLAWTDAMTTALEEQ